MGHTTIPDVVAFTAKLVRTPTVLGGEGAAARAVVDQMVALGYDEAGIDATGNAVGVVRGAHPGPTLLFDGHIDTIDVHPRAAWTRDPFGAEIIDRRMYGRGTSDMKGAVAAMVCAAGVLDRATIHGNIVVSASVGEELVEGIALEVVLASHPADFEVIGESTNFDLVHAGRGRAEFLITTHGKPAHGSVPHRGVNAVHKMMAVVREIEALPMPTHPTVGNGVMALTAIISDPYPAHSVIPSGCAATYERRLVPAETLESVMTELRAACERAGAADTTIELAVADYTSYTGRHWDHPKWFPAWEIDVQSKLVQSALKGLGAIGLQPGLASYQFCTNAAYSAGVAGIPTIGLGPSLETLAHVTDEYIELDALRTAQKAYAAIATAILAG